jgi:uncharacterized membrane protein SpoIIM required for sporulation
VNIDTFIARRQDRWRDLERLVDSTEGQREEEVPLRTVQEIVRLYRQVCSDLNQARSYTANPELLDRLNRISGRAYRFIYRGGRPERLRDAVRRLLLTEIPATFRREQRFIIYALVAMMAGALVGAAGVASDEENAQRLIPKQFFTEDVRARVERIEKSDERIDALDDAAAFGAYLYTHNIKVALLCFSLGALTIAGAYLILFYNGVMVGAIAASYVAAGASGFFFGWVGPHGALELPAIVFGAAAGLRLGDAFWMPGRASRQTALRDAFPAVWRMLIATAFVLVLAGVVEGSFSQFSSKTFPIPLKIGVAVILLVSLISYLFVWSAADSAANKGS